MNYKFNKYVYIEKFNHFEAIRFNLTNLTNNEIFANFYEGLNNILDYNYLINKFGFNLIDMEANSFWRIFIDKFFVSPSYYYMIFITIVWEIETYLFFGELLFVIGLIFCIISSYQKYTNMQKVFNYSEFFEVSEKRSFVNKHI